MKKEEERKMVFAKHKWCLFEVDREDNHFFFFCRKHKRYGNMCNFKRGRVTNFFLSKKSNQFKMHVLHNTLKSH
jgi:hypothetical protein